MRADTMTGSSSAPAKPKRGRGRQKGFMMTEHHRTKIANSQILKVLLEHVEGSREMSATQVTAGLGLLKKVLPDLSNVTISGDEENPVSVITTVELVAGSGK
jgi:hypothetical protein